MNYPAFSIWCGFACVYAFKIKWLGRVLIGINLAPFNPAYGWEASMMRYYHYILAILLVITVACSGGSKGGDAPASAPQSTEAGASPEQKPATSSEPSTIGNATASGVTIVETPVATPVATPEVKPAVVDDKPKGETPSDEPATPKAPPPAPMVASISSPVDGSAFELKPAPYSVPIVLSGASNKENATYKWTVLDSNAAPVEVQTDPKTQKPSFIPKLPGTHTITLSGSATDGTSNSVSVQVSIAKPPSEATFLGITGMNDKASYPLDSSYPLLAMSYANMSGISYFSFNWDITAKPEGSKVQLTSASHSEVFQADAEGQYTIRVTATNAVGETTSKSITVNMLPSRVVQLWGGFLGNMVPKMFLVSGDQEIYFGSDYGVIKYGSNKQWLPIINDSSGVTPISSAARASETEIYFGSKGKVLRYDRANVAVIKLPDAYANYSVERISATPSSAWIIVHGDLLHVLNNKAEVVIVDGKVLSANHVIAYAPDNVIAFGAAYNPVSQYQGLELGWKTIAPIYSQFNDDGLVAMMKCAHGGAIDPVTCISSNNSIYTIPFEDGKFGPLVKADVMNPMPQEVFIDIAWKNQGGPLLLTKSGQLYTFNTLAKSWDKTPGIQSPPLDASFGVVGSAQFDLPFVIAGAGEVYKLNFGNDNTMNWVKEALPTNLNVQNMTLVPDGKAVVAGDMGQKAAIVVVDTAKKQIVSYYKSDMDGSLHSTSGSSINNVYGIVDATLVRFDGVSLKKVTPSDETILSGASAAAVAVSPEGNKIYAALSYGSEDAKIYESDDGVLFIKMQIDVVPTKINSILVLDAKNIFAFGQTQNKYFVAWKLEESGWKKVHDHYFFFRDAYAASPNNITLVGLGGGILHFDGVNWQEETSGVTEHINAVSGANGQVWVLTVSGKLLKRDAATASWKMETNLPKSEVAGLNELLFIDAKNYIYSGPLILTLWV
jgi:hypothetical protein